MEVLQEALVNLLSGRSVAPQAAPQGRRALSALGWASGDQGFRALGLPGFEVSGLQGLGFRVRRSYSG